MSGWTVVDSVSNKSLPVQGTTASGASTPYVTPAPGTQDPVGKFRVSQPQALIDTDFEYGTQPTKWESIALQNNRQSVYFIPQQPLIITSITGTTTLTITGSFNVPANTPIFIQNATDAYANGWWWTIAGGTTSMTVIPTTAPAAGEKYTATGTYVYAGYFYSNCGISLTGTTAFTTDGTSTVLCTTTGAHGLQKDSLIYIRGTTSSGTTINGAFVVATVPTANSFTFVNTNGTVAAAAITNVANNTTLYARPSGYVEPRTFDGGVAFTAGGGSPNQQLIRQTRRYFRYQSGKGIQFSTGSSLKPALFVTSITGTGTTATVTTRYAHNLTVGSRIQVSGANQGVYNGAFTVASIVNLTSFTYTTAASIGVTPATGLIRISPLSWYGSSNRVGMFDQQNGFFFEFDGQTLYAVLRNSINQINGTVAVTNGSNIVTGTGSAFSSQLLIGDYIVIRGQSYKVLTITSDTVMQVSPEYRGTTISGALVSRTIDFRIPQNKWQDPCDGTGPSGYNIDLTRMQMWYIDYSWYGAGVVRYGFRATNGQITYITQIQNNNVQFEAYMRSGNMAAHYESNGQSAITQLSASLSTGGSTTLSAAIAVDAVTIPITSTTNFNNAGIAVIGTEYIYYTGISGGSLVGCTRGYAKTIAKGYPSGTSISPSSIDIDNGIGFAPSGTVKVQAAGATGAIEYIAYSGNDGSFLYGLTRAQTGGAATAQSFTYSATAPVAVEFASPDTVPSLSHWGSSVIMDGSFNDDKSLIFNYGVNAPVTLATSITQVTPLLAIRIAPSVDNGQTGLLGNKEIINRMQLTLLELGVVTNNTVLITLVLNGYTSGGTWGAWTPPISFGVSAVSSSLAQVSVNTLNTGTLVGGESVAAFYTNSSGQTTLDLTQVRDIGNSILGGGTNANVSTTQANVYPDGPDVLYVCATNVVSAATPTVLTRLSWKEAQA